RHTSFSRDWSSDVCSSDLYKQEKSELLIRKHMATFPDQGDLLEELSGVDHMNLYANMWKGTKKHVPQILEQLNMTSYAKKKVKRSEERRVGKRERVSGRSA